MNKTKAPKFFTTAKQFLTKHSPEILTGIGIVGMVTTTVLAVKATPKALSIIKNDLGYDPRTYPGQEKPKALDVVKATWKCYIPAAVTGVTSVACLVGANSVHASRNAALATVYQLSQTALSEYREKVVETIGEKKEQTVRDNLAKSRVEQNPVSKNEVIVTEKGNTLCYDYYSGRYFKSDIEQIKKIINELNRQMLTDDYVSLNAVYSELGLEHIPMGDDLGWNVDKGLIELDLSSQLADDGTPCVVLSYYNAPQYGYAKYM